MSVCSGRFCREVSIGQAYELVEIPLWRHPEDTPLNVCQFEHRDAVFFCAKHEADAKQITAVLRR